MAGITLTDIVLITEGLCRMDKNRDADEMISRRKSADDGFGVARL